MEEQLDTSIGIEDPHITPGRPPLVGTKPRMIVARCHSKIDKDRILKKAPRALKYKPFQGNRIYNSNDIEEESRKDAKSLKGRMKELRKSVKMAFKPWSTPRRL